MPEKVYLYLFILCVILAQEIVATFLDEDIGKSSNVIVRRKRVINRKSGKDNPVAIGSVPYVVNIKRNNHVHCIGTILSQRTVITAARCVYQFGEIPVSNLTLLSGSTYSHLGQKHNIIHIKPYAHRMPRDATWAGISLLIVDPPFEFNGRTIGSIELHKDVVLAGMRGTISGWGSYYYGGPRETSFPQRLRSITVPIMSHRECVNIYHDIFPIGEEDICTHHEKKQCGYTDTGAGLVMENKLAGVHIGTIETKEAKCPTKPDVFAFLQHSEFRVWIMNNIEL